MSSVSGSFHLRRAPVSATTMFIAASSRLQGKRGSSAAPAAARPAASSAKSARRSRRKHETAFPAKLAPHRSSIAGQAGAPADAAAYRTMGAAVSARYALCKR